jgi:molybdate/tungstate transport system substrate-binding protein
LEVKKRGPSSEACGPDGRRSAVVCLALLFSCLSACTQDDEQRERLVIFHAGSLSVPFAKVSALFQRRYPQVEVRAEAAGSRDCARKISELGHACDVLGSADYKVVEDLLQPRFVDFNVLFATNEMTIAFTDRSREADRIDSRNWPRLLLADHVAFGRSDPNHDPCGYRTLMLFQLAEQYYQTPGLAAGLTQKHGRKFMRPKETDLLAVLEAGEIDYLFIYRSVAVQHRLRYVSLPDEVNLRSPQLADHYQTARVKVAGSRPQSVVELRGEPITYSVTIPKNSRRPDLAEAWVDLLLSPEGQSVVEQCGQETLSPALARGLDQLPSRLKRWCVGSLAREIKAGASVGSAPR